MTKITALSFRTHFLIMNVSILESSYCYPKHEKLTQSITRIKVVIRRLSNIVLMIILTVTAVGTSLIMKTYLTYSIFSDLIYIKYDRASVCTINYKLYDVNGGWCNVWQVAHLC